MNKLFNLVLIWCWIFPTVAVAQELVQLEGRVVDLAGQPIEDVFVYLNADEQFSITDQGGYFTFELLANQEYTLRFQSIRITPFEQKVSITEDTRLTYNTQELIGQLQEVVVESGADAFGIRQLRSIEAGGLYEGKKTEVINIDKLVSNKGTNNARQAFSKVPSLNIWESDNAGLQLDIGGRGLSPKRTSNFNTRQNGYDISADALGYPESYYTPPFLAVQQIEVIRGAGALQYGSQFGGLVNFKMKRGDVQKPLNFETHNSYGAFNFFNTYHSIHGQVKKLNHYSYFYYKRGDGWRPNSAFEQYGAATNLRYQASEKVNIGLDFTHMYYLAQQAGGLTDEQFLEDPNQSTRSRNWFRVNWTLPAFILEYKISDQVKIYSRTFGLLARRSSLGLLTTPDEGDPEVPGDSPENRDLIDGKFRNIGNETRATFTYDTKKGLKNSLLLGTRLYRGFTNFSQFLGSTGSDASFEKVELAIDNRRKSDFDFPSINGALFAEKIIRLNSSLSLVPGVRYEFIRTESEGTLTTPVRINSFGDVIEQDSLIAQEKNRNILLVGLGISRKLGERYELYANATSNYRAINFTDIQIQTNTQLVDTLIKDESGYSFDIGIRKQDFDPFFLELGLFFLQYNDRIGEVLDDGLRVRTNIGDGRIVGFELFFEANILKILKKESEHKLTFFVNGSINRGVYTNVNDRSAGVVRSGKRLEDIPQYNLKSGIAYGYRRFSATLQGTFVGEQFSDAQNTRVQITPLQETTGVFGEIPAYSVVDLSAKFELSKRINLSGTINNLLNQSYFTRRATAYPGPGIIPAQPRSYFLTMHLKI